MVGHGKRNRLRFSNRHHTQRHFHRNPNRGVGLSQCHAVGRRQHVAQAHVGHQAVRDIQGDAVRGFVGHQLECTQFSVCASEFGIGGGKAKKPDGV